MNREITPAPSYAVPGSYHAELPSDLLDTHGQLIDRVISFAFDTLGASRLDSPRRRGCSRRQPRQRRRCGSIG